MRVRLTYQVGQDCLAALTGVPLRTVNRFWCCHRMPSLAKLDMIAGRVVRASRSGALRDEHDRSGSLVHTDVKKLGQFPRGGG